MEPQTQPEIDFDSCLSLGDPTWDWDRPYFSLDYFLPDFPGSTVMDLKPDDHLNLLRDPEMQQLLLNSSADFFFPDSFLGPRDYDHFLDRMFDFSESTTVDVRTEGYLNLQIEPQVQLQQQLVGLDLENVLRQILLLSATDVFESQLLRLNHFLEEWKTRNGPRRGSSFPSSYSQMVYELHASQLRPQFIEAMDYVESAFLDDLEARGYENATEFKVALRQDLTVYLTKAKKEGGRNDVAHPFSTSIEQESNSAPGKVRRLLDTAVDRLTQSQKDYNLQILDLLSNSQNLPECYRDLAQVAFPLQIFFLRDVMEKSKPLR